MLQKNGCAVWSFDPGNCEKYQFNLYRQFIVKIPGLEQWPVARDFSFCGFNKGRADMVSAVARRFTEQKLVGDIAIKHGVKDGRSRHDYDRPMPYVEYLQRTLAAKCVLDIAKKNQRGLTLRPLEAMVYKRKLITNCAEVREAPFYRRSNIIVFEDPRELSGCDLREFVNTPFVDIPQADLQPFTLDALLAQIRQAHENGAEGRAGGA